MIKFSPGNPCCQEQECRKFNFSTSSFYVTLPTLVANTGNGIENYIYYRAHGYPTNCNIFYGTYLLDQNDLLGRETLPTPLLDGARRGSPTHYNPDMSFERYEKTISFSQNMFNNVVDFRSGVYTVGLQVGCHSGIHVFYPYFTAQVNYYFSGTAVYTTATENLYGYGTGYKQDDISSLDVYNSPLTINCNSQRTEDWWFGTSFLPGCVPLSGGDFIVQRVS